MNKNNQDYIPLRIEFIKGFLDGNDLSPLIDVNVTDTEAFTNKGNAEKTYEVLRKEELDFNTVINKIGGKLLYINSGTGGHTFKGVNPNDPNAPNYALKVVAYPKRTNYGDYDDISRPENAELLMLKVLSYFVINKQTPHIVLPIGTFNTNIKLFIDIYAQGKVNRQTKSEDGKEKTENEKYKMFVDKYNKGEFHDKVSVLISEWANGGDLLQYFRAKRLENEKISLAVWKVLFFQILSVLTVIQTKYPSFRHNDMKANNILLHYIGKAKGKNNHFLYRINEREYVIPNIGMQIKLWDFDFASIEGVVDNSKVNDEWTNKINVNKNKNQYYDIHYFFTTLTKKGFFSEFWEGDNVPSEVKDFVRRVVPAKYEPVFEIKHVLEEKWDDELKTKIKRKVKRLVNVNPNISQRCRLLKDDEYTTPEKLLINDPFFKIFRRF